MPLRSLIKQRLEALGEKYEETPGSEWITVHCLHADHIDNNMSAGINTTSGIHHCFSSNDHNFKFIKPEEDDDADTETLIWQAKYDAYKVSSEEPIESTTEFHLPPIDKPIVDEWRGLSTDLLKDCSAYYCSRGLFQGRYIFPCYSDGELKGYDARIVDDTARATQAKWLRAKDMDVKSLVYPKDVLEKRFDNLEHVVITEGVADALSYIQMDVPAIASFGLTPPNSLRINQLIAMGVTKVTLAFDNDEAGIAGMVKVLPVYQEWFEIVAHPMVTMVNMSQYKDANEFLEGVKANGIKKEESWDDDFD